MISLYSSDKVRLGSACLGGGGVFTSKTNPDSSGTDRVHLFIRHDGERDVVALSGALAAGVMALTVTRCQPDTAPVSEPVFREYEPSA